MTFASQAYYPTDVADERTQNQELLDQLYWMTADERSPYRLADDPDWPGLFPEPADLQRYVDKLRNSASRQVECRFDLGYAELPGMFDLVSGKLSIVYDGQYQDLDSGPDGVTILFKQLEPSASLFVRVNPMNCAVILADNAEKTEPMSLGQLLSLPKRTATRQQVASIVERLAHEGKLPAVEYDS